MCFGYTDLGFLALGIWDVGCTVLGTEGLGVGSFRI